MNFNANMANNKPRVFKYAKKIPLTQNYLGKLCFPISRTMNFTILNTTQLACWMLKGVSFFFFLGGGVKTKPNGVTHF